MSPVTISNGSHGIHLTACTRVFTNPGIYMPDDDDVV